MILTDESVTAADSVAANGTKRNSLPLKEDETVRIDVEWHDQTVESADRRANCTGREATPEPLPRTGPEDDAMFAKAATGIAAMITGAIVFWYGCLWPRRRDGIFG